MLLMLWLVLVLIVTVTAGFDAKQLEHSIANRPRYVIGDDSTVLLEEHQVIDHLPERHLMIGTVGSSFVQKC